MKSGQLITYLLAWLVWAPFSISAYAESIKVSAEPIAFNQLLNSATEFGALTYLGGLHLTSESRKFGGYSGLAISSDGRQLLSISDDGWWFRADLVYESRRLRNVENPEIAPLLTADGIRSRSKIDRDAEGLAILDPGTFPGRALVAFERNTRLEQFDLSTDGFSAKPTAIRHPKDIRFGPENKELEAVAHISSGQRQGTTIALSERHLDGDGNIRGWMWSDAETTAFSLGRYDDYQITDMALLPENEQFLTIERSFSPSTLPGMAIRRFAIDELTNGATVEGELLFSGRQPVYAIDNMEGLAVHVGEDGKVILTVISDDNFNRRIQRTLLLQFAISSTLPATD